MFDKEASPKIEEEKQQDGLQKLPINDSHDQKPQDQPSRNEGNGKFTYP